MKRYHVILVASFVVAGLCAAGTIDAKSEKANTSRYCDMVKQYKDTNGKKGWPDFEKTYRHECLGIKS